MRLTSPFNLPAPGRRQCLYVVFHDFAGTCVFDKQSLGPILCGLLRLPEHYRSPTTGSPSPEVTGTFCRVPSPQFTRAPEASRLAYVCPFAVRSQNALPAEAFLGSPIRQTRHPEGHLGIRSRLPGSFIPRDRLPPCTGTTTARPCFHSCVPPAGGNAHPVVRDYSPVSHRLRPSASA